MILILHPDGRTLQLDTTDNLGLSAGGRAAESPIEEGAPAVDHVQPSNGTVQITCSITEIPRDGPQLQASIQGYNVESVTAGLTGPERVHAAADFLADCMGEFVDIVSSEGRFVYTNCLLIQYPYRFQLVRASEFLLQFVQPRLVEVEVGVIPPLPKVPSEMHPPTETGAAPTEELTADDVSYLNRLWRGITGQPQNYTRPVAAPESGSPEGNLLADGAVEF